jgi:hypothetical protein
MVDELYYEKNQLLIDAEGELWILIDIVESKSLLTKRTKPTLTAFVRKRTLKKGDKEKIFKFSFKKFSETFSPFLHADKNLVDKIISWESLLDVDAVHPLQEEN